MGQLCFKEEIIIVESKQEKIPVKNQPLNYQIQQSKRQSLKTLKHTSFMEDNTVQNISRDIKITIKQKKSGNHHYHHDTEDENYEAGNSNSQESVKSEMTISHHRNRDQDIKDIPSKEETLPKDKLNRSKAKSTASRQTNQTKKLAAAPQQYFTGTYGHNSYLDYSHQSQISFDEEEINNQILRGRKRIASEQPSIRKKINKQAKESVLSEQA